MASPLDVFSPLVRSALGLVCSTLHRLKLTSRSAQALHPFGTIRPDRIACAERESEVPFCCPIPRQCKPSGQCKLSSFVVVFVCLFLLTLPLSSNLSISQTLVSVFPRMPIRFASHPFISNCGKTKHSTAPPQSG